MQNSLYFSLLLLLIGIGFGCQQYQEDTATISLNANVEFRSEEMAQYPRPYLP